MASRQSCQYARLSEKPSSARAVMPTLTAVILPVPRRLCSALQERAETTVPAEMIMEISPPPETDAPRLSYMLGQAAPRSPSGRPREMKAR